VYQLTRKLSYRKDDRAMRPIYACPENFWESLSTPTAFPKVLMSFYSDRPCERGLRTKFEVRNFTRSWDNRGYLKKLGQSLDMPTLPFLQNC